jgi:Beta-lactamase superfamily domain
MKSLGSKASGARLERMRSSPQWAGEGFHNVHPILQGLRDPNASMPSLSDFLCGSERGNPVRPLPSLNPLESWRYKVDTGLRVTWLGHSTTLIEIGGLRVLTDPVWGSRASPLSLAGPKRFQPVPVALREMPPVDLVIISHDHYDHLDYPTVRALVKSDVPFVTSLGVGAHLEAWGIAPERITELDWWESYDLPTGGVRVTAAPSQHCSGPRSSFVLNGIASFSAATQVSRRSTGIFASDSGRSISRCSKSARGLQPGVICILGRRMRSRLSHSWKPKRFSRSIGGRSASPCIRGMSLLRFCTSRLRQFVRGSSCPNSENRLSPGAPPALWTPGGEASIRWTDFSSPPARLPAKGSFRARCRFRSTNAADGSRKPRLTGSAPSALSIQPLTRVCLNWMPRPASRAPISAAAASSI